MASLTDLSPGLSADIRIEENETRHGVVAGVDTATMDPKDSLLSNEYDCSPDLFTSAFGINIDCGKNPALLGKIQELNQQTEINTQIQPGPIGSVRQQPLNIDWDKNPALLGKIHELNQQTEINTQIQPGPIGSVRQQPLFNTNTWNNPQPPVDNLGWDTQQQPIQGIDWNSQQQPFNNSQWNIPPAGHPFWLQFPLPQYLPQVDMFNGNPNTVLNADLGHNLAFGGYAPNQQISPPFFNQGPVYATQPRHTALAPITQSAPLGIPPPRRETLMRLDPIEPERTRLQLPDEDEDELEAQGFVELKTHKEREEHLAKRLRTGPKIFPSTRRRNIRESDKEDVCSRTARLINFDPSDYYEPLSSTPENWGPLDSDGRHKFRYNHFGELRPSTTYSNDEMIEYLFSKFPSSEEPSAQQLLIQCVPSDSNSRYPTSFSDKCRFSSCPVRTRTIPKGHFRVAFDGRNDAALDPFHCAGFAHLYCLERFCSFALLARHWNIVPDGRELREGPNRMAVTRDLNAGFRRKCMVYLEKARQSDPHAGGWEYANTLCSLLTEVYLDREAPSRQEKREAGGGGDNIGVHRNDMEKFAEGERVKMGQRARERKKKKRRSALEARGAGKRKREGGESGEEEG